MLAGGRSSRSSSSARRTSATLQRALRETADAIRTVRRQLRRLRHRGRQPGDQVPAAAASSCRSDARGRRHPMDDGVLRRQLRRAAAGRRRHPEGAERRSTRSSASSSAMRARWWRPGRARRRRRTSSASASGARPPHDLKTSCATSSSRSTSPRTDYQRHREQGDSSASPVICANGRISSQADPGRCAPDQPDVVGRWPVLSQLAATHRSSSGVRSMRRHVGRRKGARSAPSAYRFPAVCLPTAAHCDRGLTL